MTAKKTNKADHSEKYSEKEQWEDDLDVMPLNYEKPGEKKPILEKQEFDKKKKRRWIPLVIFVGAAVTTTLVIVFSNSDDTPAKSVTTTVSGSNADGEQDMNGSEVSVNEEIQEEPIMPQEDSMSMQEISEEIRDVDYALGMEERTGNYHIVVGSFEGKKNADLFAEGLKDLYEGVRVLEYDGMYRVSFLSVEDSDQAEIELDIIRNTLLLSAWIAYMR